MMQKILDALKAKRPLSAAEIRERLAEIDSAGAQATVEALQAQRERLLLDASEHEIEAIEGSIRSAQRDIDRQRVAKLELERLLTEAIDREKLAEVDRRAAEAWALNTKLLQAYASMHEAAVDLTEQLAVIRDGEAALREINAFTGAAGRRDLKVPWPRSQLMELLGLTENQLPDPVREWTMRGYWPDRPSFTNGSMMTAPLRGDRRFDRATELLPPAAKRKAA